MGFFMNYRIKSKIFIFLIISIVLSSFSTVILSKSLNNNIGLTGRFTEGQILFSPYYEKKTYLINNTGYINHTWSSAYSPGASTYWIGDGTILRSISSGVGGSSSGVQKVLWDGTIFWDFRYDYDGYLSHHDVEYLPNGRKLINKK